MELSEEDLVVVPGCGVGRVERLETIDVGGGPIRAYRIDLGPDAGRLWVPVEQVGAQGLRAPMDAAAVTRTWKLIESQEAPAKRDHWNQRQQRYRAMVMSNQPQELARLIGELVAVRAQLLRDKKAPLAFGEQKVLEQAKRLVVEEIAASTGKETEAVAQTLDEVIAAAA